jgi:hypothetical protein
MGVGVSIGTVWGATVAGDGGGGCSSAIDGDGVGADWQRLATSARAGIDRKKPPVKQPAISITDLFINDLLTSSGGCARSDGAAPSREGCGPAFAAQRRGPAGDMKMRERLTSTRQGCHFRLPLPLADPTSTKPAVKWFAHRPIDLYSVVSFVRIRSRCD